MSARRRTCRTCRTTSSSERALMVAACSSSVASSTRGDRSARRSSRRRHLRALDDALGADRGPNGEPSASDFIVLELPPIVDRFAIDFDGLPEIAEGVPAGRMLITSGVLVRAVAVFGLATSDTTIGLIGVTIEP